MDRLRPWTPPALVDQIVGLSEGDDWQPIVEAGGSWCNVDFYFQGPNAWLDTEFRIECQELDQVVVLERKALRDLALMTIRAGTVAAGVGITAAADGVISGILFSIRGRPSTKFMVSALKGEEALAPAKCYLRCWGDESQGLRDREATSVAAPFAEPHQQFNFSFDLGAGSTTVVPANPNGGRAYITGLGWFTDEANPLAAELERESAFAGPFIERRWLVGGAVAEFDETFSYPLRSDRGQEWNVVLAGPVAGQHRFNVTGYYD